MLCSSQGGLNIFFRFTHLDAVPVVIFCIETMPYSIDQPSVLLVCRFKLCMRGMESSSLLLGM